MSKNAMIKAILGLVEDSYANHGSDPTAANAIYVLDDGFNIQARAEEKARNLVKSTFSPEGSRVSGALYELSAAVEVVGGGLDESRLLKTPHWDPLLQCCAFPRTACEVLYVDATTGFTLGMAVTGDVSGASGTVLEVESGALVLTGVTGAFDPSGEGLTGEGDPAPTATAYALLELASGHGIQAGDNITGSSSSATGTVVSIADEYAVVGSVASGPFTDADTVTAPPDHAGDVLLARGSRERFEYRPVTAVAEQPSGEFWCYWDGLLHKLTGARGTGQLTFNSGDYGEMSFTVTGLFELPADADMPVAPSIPDLTPPVGENMGITVAGYTPSLTNLQITLGNTVTGKKNLNAAEGYGSVRVTNREPSGSLDPAAVALSAFNPWSLWRGGTKGLISGTLGSSRGNRVRVVVGQAQHKTPSYTNQENDLVYNDQFAACRVNQGDDEIRLIIE